MQQLYMDGHNLLRAAMRIELTAPQRKALFAAFALSGIHINRSRPAANAAESG